MNDLYSYPTNDYRRYLAHHGILNQKWGVKHGPPYPLDREVSLEIRKNRYNPKRDTFEDEYYTRKNSKVLSNEPKRERLKDLDKKLKVSKSKKQEIENDLKAVNPRYDHDSKIGSYFNCRNCATAFEMRRRGYDVEARRREDGSNAGGAEKFFKNGKFTRLVNDFENDDFFKIPYKSLERKFLESKSSYDERLKEHVDKYGPEKLQEYRDKAFNNLCSELSKQGRGARGIVVIGWQKDDEDMTKRTSLFHAINYEVGDTVQFYDSQSAYKDTKYSYGFAKDYVDPRDYSYMRTDNLEPSELVTQAVISKSKSDRKGKK